MAIAHCEFTDSERLLLCCSQFVVTCGLELPRVEVAAPNGKMALYLGSFQNRCAEAMTLGPLPQEVS
jgi:hypothetical protein